MAAPRKVRALLDGAAVLCQARVLTCLAPRSPDLKFDGEASALIVGRACVIREHATLHRGTAASGRTQLGAGVLVMSSAHVAHDCVIDDAVILASGCQLAGHVRVHARAIVGGNAAVHQHSHIGASAMIGGLAAVRGHVPPFTLASGNTARLRGLNLVGLRRMRWANRDIAALHAAYRFIFAPAHATLNPTPRWPAADTIEQRARNVLAATTDAVALQGASTTATDAVREMASFVLAVRRRSALCTAGS